MHSRGEELEITNGSNVNWIDVLEIHLGLLCFQSPINVSLRNLAQIIGQFWSIFSMIRKCFVDSSGLTSGWLRILLVLKSFSIPRTAKSLKVHTCLSLALWIVEELLVYGKNQQILMLKVEFKD